METIKWVLCPICGNKTRTIMQEDTELKNFPLYCPKCKQQTLVNVKHFVVSVSIDSANSSRNWRCSFCGLSVCAEHFGSDANDRNGIAWNDCISIYI